MANCPLTSEDSTPSGCNAHAEPASALISENPRASLDLQIALLRPLIQILTSSVDSVACRASVLGLLQRELELESIWLVAGDPQGTCVPLALIEREKSPELAQAPLHHPLLDCVRRCCSELILSPPPDLLRVGHLCGEQDRTLILPIENAQGGLMLVLRRDSGRGFDLGERACLSEIAQNMASVLRFEPRTLPISGVEETLRLRELEDIVDRSPAVAILWRNMPGWPVEYVSRNIRIFGYESDDLTSGRLLWSDLIHPDDLPSVQDSVSRHTLPGEEYQQRYRIRSASGEYRHVDDLTRVRRDSVLRITHFEGIIFDVTRQWEAESRLRQASAMQEALNALLRLSLQEIPLEELLTRSLQMLLTSIQSISLESRGAVYLTDPLTGRMLRSSVWDPRSRGSAAREPFPNEECPYGCAGSTRPEACAPGCLPGPRRVLSNEHEQVEQWCIPLLARGRAFGRVAMTLPQGQRLCIWETHLMQAVSDLLAGIIERRRADEAMRRSEDRFRVLFEQSPVGIGILRHERLVQVNPAFLRMFGALEERHATGRSFSNFIDSQSLVRVQERLDHAAAGSVSEASCEAIGRRKDGSTFPIHLVAHQADLLEGAAWVVHLMDMSESHAAEACAQRQLRRLGALRVIDSAISGSSELQTTLELLLVQLIEQLQVDAADVLLIRPDDQRLEFAAGRGFRTSALQYTRLALGEGHAGWAALKADLVHISDLSSQPGDLRRSRLISVEQFVSYWGIPLVAKGTVRGVLEVFRRTPEEPPADWVEYLQTLAAQAAIAIDNAMLTEEIKRTCEGLNLAYDETIEGWARALELRDRETEGHTRRVTDLTLKLARAMSIPAQQMSDIRYGAILHDIGKMGIPDSILLKPGTLDRAEWALMRLHPVYANDLLQPIAYLKSAIEIPFAHHERWDGAGYPLGLQGKEIPIAARIFALVDVWDALHSPRPYKRAWTRAEVREYIRAQAGIQFDPKITEAFLAMEETGG